MSEAMAQGNLDMLVAENQGLDNAEPRIPQSITPTSLRQWCEEVFKPAVTGSPTACGTRLGSGGRYPEGSVVAMGQDRQWVVDTLRRLGYEHEAEEAARVLPDPVEMKQLTEFGDRYGISVDELTSRMGGSP